MKIFYLQDSRSYLGNSMLWWSKDNKGYTTDLSQAQEFTLDEAMEQHRKRETDIPWPAEYISERMQLTVDMQYVRRSHLHDYGIDLQVSKMPRKRQVFNCPICGAFRSEVRPDCIRCGEKY